MLAERQPKIGCIQQCLKRPTYDEFNPPEEWLGALGQKYIETCKLVAEAVANSADGDPKLIYYALTRYIRSFGF